MDETVRTVNKYNRSSDIVFVLKAGPEGALKPSGMVDKRLFTGENNLHAKMDKQTCLWHLEYDSGILPPEFRTQYTSWNKIYNHVTDYYRRRNVEITEIRDGPPSATIS